MLLFVCRQSSSACVVACWGVLFIDSSPPPTLTQATSDDTRGFVLLRLLGPCVRPFPALRFGATCGDT